MVLLALMVDAIFKMFIVALNYLATVSIRRVLTVLMLTNMTKIPILYVKENIATMIDNALLVFAR